MNKRSYIALESTESAVREPSDVAALKKVNFGKHQRGSLTLEKPYASLSLASLITQTPRSSLELFHAAAVRDLDRHSSHVRFALPSFDENTTEEQEPQPKRRRYQRRCSKTAAMLLPAATLQALDNLCDLSEAPQEACTSVEEWDHRSSIDVAEDLVQELHELRSQSSV
jgi:hypothetical protein